MTSTMNTERSDTEVLRDGWVAVVYAKNGDISKTGDTRRTRWEALRDLLNFKIDSKLFRKEVRHSIHAQDKVAWTTWKERERDRKRLDRRIKRGASRIVG